MVVVNNGTSVFLQTLIYMMNQTSVQEDNSYSSYYLDIGQGMNTSKCYGIYGCFELSPPWTSDHRPVSLFPEALQKIEPHYLLYTRKNLYNPYVFDLNDFEMIESSGINPNNPVYTITHGYMEGGGIPWILEMAREFLKYEDCSVIVIDWHGGSSPPYTQAVANIRLVGAMTAHLLADLARFTGHLKLDHVHCIGHSLGAHLSGYIGYTLQKEFNLTLGRITGLDPAEPHFAKAKPPVRLDKTAAKYVDIIHTDASQFIRGGLGITERIGHVDYFPNGGTNQPGCGKSVVEYISDEKGSLFKGFKKYLSCNHIRSHEYFMDSISPDNRCSFTTISCKNFEDFTSGRCFSCGQNGEKCIRFGYHSRKQYEKLVKSKLIKPNDNMMQFLLTGERKPYCRGHYRITVKISDSEESKSHGGEIGRLSFVMHSSSDGKGAKSKPIAFNNGGYHEPGAIYTNVVAGDEVKQLKGVEIQWIYNSSIFNPLTWRLLTTPKIYVDLVKVDALEINQSIVVCPKEKKPLLTSVPIFMISSYC